MQVKLRRPSAATVMAFMALMVALSGTAVGEDAVSTAKKLITGKQIKDNSVSSRDIKNGSLLAKDFKPGQIPAGPAGPRGEQGPPGPSTGPAGGDLEGSYPNPKLRAPTFTRVGSPGSQITCESSHDGCWYNEGSPTPLLGYARDPFGFVHLSGTVYWASTTGQDAPPMRMIFELPPGYRPDVPLTVPATVGGMARELEILRSGAVLLNAPVANYSRLLLEGISFRCAPSGENGCP